MTIEQYVNAVISPCMSVFCAFAVIYTIVKRGKDIQASRMMICSLIAGMIFNGAEAFAYYFKGSGSELAYAMVRSSNLTAFLAIYVLIIFEMGYLWRRMELRGARLNRYLRMFGLVMCGVGMALVIMSRFLDFYYTFDSDNVFTPSYYYWLHILIICLSVAPMLIQTVLNRNVLRRREFRPFLCLSLLPLLGIVAQLLIPWDISLYSIAVSISIIIIFTVYRGESSDISVTLEDMDLSYENIDLVSEEVENFLVSLEMEKRNRLRLRLLLEEILLRIQGKFGEDEKFDLFAMISFGRPQIRLEKGGKLYNPLHKEEDEPKELGGRLLTSVGLNPVFSYSGGRNIVKIPLQRLQMNPALKMATCMIIGLIAGGVAVHKLSHADQVLINNELLGPVSEIMTNMLYCVAGPILFFMVASVILNGVGLSDQGGNSLSTTVRYLVLSFLRGIIALIVSGIAVYAEFNNLNPGKNHFGSVLDGLLSVVPKDIFTPFVEANTPQLMLMSIVLSFAVAVLGNKASRLNDMILQLNEVGMKLAEWIGRIIPLFAVVLAAMILLNGRLRELLLMFPVMLVSVVITILCMFIIMFYTKLRQKVRISVLLRKCMPSFMTAFKAGYLDASYGQSEYCCINKLGVDRNYVKAGMSLGLVMYMPANVVGTVLFLAYASVSSKVLISPMEMIIAVVMAVMLFVATPPIPGANILAYIAIISMLQIGNEFLVLALMFEIIYGVFASAANQFFVQMELIQQSGSIGLLNKKVLRSK